MPFLSLDTWHFRNLRDGAVEFAPGVNLFTGLNGQGKTSLLEALYCACYSKSFRTSRLDECITYGESAARVRCRVAGEPLPHVLEVRLGPAGKEMLADGKSAGIADFLRTVAVLCVTAEQLRTITEGPDRRRRFFDGLIALFHPDYLHYLAAYRRILRQKNTLLAREPVSAAAVEPWNRKLVEASREIVRRRLAFLELVAPAAARDRFSGAAIGLLYRPSLTSELLAGDAPALAFLMGRLEQEAARGRSLSGVHLDRWEFLLDGRNVRHFASSGQKRSVLLSVYLAVLALLEEERGTSPVLMLDDVDTELDLPRIRRLLELLDSRTQIFLTSAKPEIFRELLPGRTVYTISEGTVSARDGN